MPGRSDAVEEDDEMKRTPGRRGHQEGVKLKKRTPGQMCIRDSLFSMFIVNTAHKFAVYIYF